MAASTSLTRESWLVQAVALLSAELLTPLGYKLPDKIRVSVGFPYGRRGGKGQHAIGQCWSAKASSDGFHEIFISPELDKADRVTDVLIHELVHVVAGIEAGHRKAFRNVAVACGLEGQMTATVASSELQKRIKGWLGSLPKYPHRSLLPGKGGDGPKKQGTRMRKLVCTEESCGYTVRTSQKWIDVGLPVCPCGEQMECNE
jgi:hypothetical protein